MDCKSRRFHNSLAKKDAVQQWIMKTVYGDNKFEELNTDRFYSNWTLIYEKRIIHEKLRTKEKRFGWPKSVRRDVRNRQKLYRLAIFAKGKADKATKWIGYREGERGWGYHLHGITFNSRYVKSVSGVPLAVALSEVRDRRGMYKTGRLYLCMYTAAHAGRTISDYVTVSVVMGMIRPQQSIKDLRIRPLV